MGRKEQRIVLASDHNLIRVGDKIVLETMGKRPPRMTIEELAQIVYEGFKRIDERFTEVNARIDKLEIDINSRIDKLETKLNTVITLNNLRVE